MNKINLPALWQFSLALYKNESVQHTLIQAQDELAANVNLALLCAMLNNQNMSLSYAQLSCLHTVVTDFSNKFTKPLRNLRGAYKQNENDIEDYPTIRKNLLTAELVFEQQEQSILIQQLTKLVAKTVNELPVNSDNLLVYQAVLTSLNTSKPASDCQLTDLNQYLV